ncbi:signal recognition particle-docking protein FtsY [Candidatus Pacearchaeota archaeon]|nr:signal recognition particle-docking protein FtsY [Candidatus Pacearchaeota archaeon]
MFKLFKEKLKSWTKKISEKVGVEEKPKKKEKKAPKEKKKKIEKEIPVKFNEGMQQFQPDLEKLKKEIEEENKPGTESFFKKITSRLQKVRISEKDFQIYSEELETLLLENNVAFEVTEQIIRKLKERVVNKEFIKKEVEEEIKDTLRKIIEDTLVEPFDIINNIRKKKAEGKPYVILFCGINGSGKTTSVAKIADYLKDQKISSVMAAGDTFRAASIEQLKKHGDKLEIKVISHEYGSDPASVGFDAIKYAEKNLIDCVLIDTAGRMHTAKDLLREIEKIARVCKPDLKIFVGESITGNDVVLQAKSFNEAIGIDGIILTKSDIDEKGGTALSVGYVTKKPILFLGTGQDYSKIEIFDKNKFVERLGL